MKDAKGYGGGNPNHDPHTGKFSSGSAADGDPSKQSPATRNVPGHGVVARSTVVAKHAGAASVGTSPVRIDNANSPAVKPGLGSAKSDRITQMRATDARHYGIEGADRTAMTDLGKPMTGVQGAFKVRTRIKFKQ